MTIEKLMLENVRCFAGRNEFNIRPLTFLVGENSTGKSTALGCFQVLSTFLDDGTIDFNKEKEPYKMGAFRDIVRKSSPENKNFTIGFGLKSETGSVNAEVMLRNADDADVDRSGLVVNQIKLKFAKGDVILEPAKKRGVKRSILFSIPFYMSSHGIEHAIDKGRDVFKVKTFSPFKALLDFSVFRRMEYNPDFFERGRGGEKSEASAALAKFLMENKADDYLRFMRKGGVSVQSIAPIRSKPERTYDPKNSSESSEGGEIPELLLRLSQRKEWDGFREKLIGFGEKAGLFDDIAIRKLKLGGVDPFRLEFRIRGRGKFNILDVGYGVSQALPILVKAFRGHGKILLLQQPEVHLHPRGQAELSTLFVNMVNTTESSFVIETHSDAMINRARIEIMQGNIKPEDVSLVYLSSEPRSPKVRVHNIRFDENGNMLDVPNGYRQFFLNESDKLLGFK